MSDRYVNAIAMAITTSSPDDNNCQQTSGECRSFPDNLGVRRGQTSLLKAIHVVLRSDDYCYYYSRV